MPVLDSSPCSCGSGLDFDRCCGPLLRNERQAEGVEELMRSRYCAYAVGNLDHLFRTWHPRTRPEQIEPDPALTWTHLEILDSEQDQDTGVVEFRAHWQVHGQKGVLAERSVFERRGGRWVYVEAVPQ